MSTRGEGRRIITKVPQGRARQGLEAAVVVAILGLLASVAALQGRAMATFALLVLAVVAVWAGLTRTSRALPRAGLLAVGALAVVAVVLLQFVGTGEDSPRPSARSEKAEGSLQIVRTSVLDDVSVAGAVQPLEGNGSAEPIEETVNAIEILARNTSTQVSVFTEASLEIIRHATLVYCTETGPYEDITAEYEAQLPHPASEGDEVRVQLSQSIPADDVDRFALTVGSNDGSSLTSQLFELRVTLYHDGAEEALDAGTVVVTAPTATPPYLDEAELGECAVSNAEAVVAFTDGDAALSPGFEALAREARALIQRR